MGLIKAGIKYGALFAAASSVSKTLVENNRGQQQQQQQQQYYPPPQWCYNEAPPAAARCWTDGSGYLHLPQCNGACRHACNGPESININRIDNRAPPTQPVPLQQNIHRDAIEGPNTVTKLDGDLLLDQPPIYTPKSAQAF